MPFLKFAFLTMAFVQKLILCQSIKIINIQGVHKVFRQLKRIIDTKVDSFLYSNNILHRELAFHFTLLDVISPGPPTLLFCYSIPNAPFLRITPVFEKSKILSFNYGLL